MIEILDYSYVTQCPLAVARQPSSVWLYRLCLEPVTSSQTPPAESFLQSHTSPFSLQGAVTFQLNAVACLVLPWLAPLSGATDMDTVTLVCIFSIIPK